MKYIPSIRRVLVLNALALGLILAIFLAVLYPAWEAGTLLGGKEQAVNADSAARTFSRDFQQARETSKKWATIMPLAILGLVFLTSVALMIFQFTEIPRYVEFTAAGVRLGRWLTQETFIPYQEIIEVDERHPSRLISAAICIRTKENPRLGYRLAIYAFPDAPEIYRQLQLRVAER
jgi:hypothetical protein